MCTDVSRVHSSSSSVALQVLHLEKDLAINILTYEIPRLHLTLPGSTIKKNPAINLLCGQQQIHIFLNKTYTLLL